MLSRYCSIKLITRSKVVGMVHKVVVQAKAMRIAIYKLLYQIAILVSAMEADS